MSEVYFYVYKVRQRLWSTRTTRPMANRPMKEGFPLEENETERNEEQDREREEDKEKDGEKKERKDDSLVEEGGFWLPGWIFYVLYFLSIMAQHQKGLSLL